MKRGFTLVELLAVIVILAVIALITIPAVMKIIDSSTTNSYRRSIDLYGKAVSQAIVSYESDMVEKGKGINVTFDNIEPYIEYEGNDVDCKDKTIYSDKTILLTECYVDEELVKAEKNKGYSDENYYYYTNLKKKAKLIKYIEAVEEEIKDKNISGICTIGEDKITCNSQDIKIKSKLENAIEGNLTIENSKVKSYSNLKFETEKKVETNNEVPQVIDEQNTNNGNNNNNQTSTAICKSKNGTMSTDLGAEYECEVKEGTKYNFYILSKEGNNVNLIMDRNICGSASNANASTNGQAATADNTCLIEWHEGDNNNTYGPDTAMQGLHNATKNWTNVPPIDLSGIKKYIDENNVKTDWGYTEITTDKGVATILGKPVTKRTIIGTENEPLRSRLPKESEIYGLDEKHCGYNERSCPYWLTDGLEQNSTYYQNNYHISSIYGYWLLSSYPETISTGRYVDYYGYIFYNQGPSHYGNIGIRAVITVPMSYLTN